MDLDIYADPKKIEKKLLNIFPSQKRDPINLAIKLAKKHHKNRIRINGETEFTHCIAVGLKAAEMGLGPKTVAGAILHDLLELEEDKEKIKKEIKEMLGDDVLNLVQNVTIMQNEKAEKVGNFTDLSSAQKFILSSVSDARVIMIKLAEKFHNLLTIDPLPKVQRDVFLNEMKRIYIPLSEYLGLGNIHKQLSDLLLKKEDRMRYDLIEDFIAEKRKISEQTKDEIVDELKTVCEMGNIEAEVEGRTKSITSIYKKKKKYQKEGKVFKLDNIFDIIAFRIITKTIEDCYKIKSILINLYEEVEGSDDYIANPKPNGYKSIHLNLKHPQKGILEIQIRTQEMHMFNEYGPASHIAYKASGKKYAKPTNEFEWVRTLHEHSKEEDKPIKTKLFDDQVFVFTPKGDIIQLPKGSTVIDFAYNVHTALGNQCAGATVNGKSASLDTKLETGDIIEIRVDKNKKHASENWGKIAFTSIAKRSIKNSLGKKYRDSI